MKKIALFFNRPYIDAHACFMELARELVNNGFFVDLYYVQNPYNTPPLFFSNQIRTFLFPRSKFQIAYFWSHIVRRKDRNYVATFGTPIQGIWLAYKVAKYLGIPHFYLADEIFDPTIKFHKVKDWHKAKKMDIKANKSAAATIALGKDRYYYQKSVNQLPEDHPWFVIPNAPSGSAGKVKSNFFRDMLDIKDHKPIVLFLGSFKWKLAKALYEQTKKFGEKDFHIVFHSPSVEIPDEDLQSDPFIKISKTPLPSYLINYAVSSADLGLVLYNKDYVQDRNNGWTGGKIGVYLKNNLPLIAGNLPEFADFEQKGVGKFWDGSQDISAVIHDALDNLETMKGNIKELYNNNYRYDFFFKKFLKFFENYV